MEAKGALYNAAPLAHPHPSGSSSSSVSHTSSTSAADPSGDEDATPSIANYSPLSAPSKSPADSTERPQSTTPSTAQGPAEASGSTRQLRRASSGPRAARSGSERDKRKRSRVTPEQLVHLERFFGMDRSPTAARRKEISHMLGMQERQTQIWFQNRRAKAKLLDGKSKPKSDTPPPGTPPALHQSYETELHKLIHEEDAITIIPCYELTIGTWRRIATQIGKHDLVTYVCENRQCLVWYIQSSGYGFKMEVPFGYIKEVTYQPTAYGKGIASFFLAQAPQFFIEEPISADGAYTSQRRWRQSADWTENSQASHELRHDITGSFAQLAHVLRQYNLPLAASSSVLGHSPPAPISTPPAHPPASVSYDLSPVAQPSDAPPFDTGYFDHRLTLHSSVVSPIEVQRRSSYSTLGSAVGIEQIDYPIERDSVSRSATSLQPSPAPSYTSYSQLAPSPGHSSAPYTSSPIPPSSHYSTPTMYSLSRAALGDQTQIPAGSRGYSMPAYPGIPASTPASTGHSHFPTYGIPLPAAIASPNLMGVPYGTRSEAVMRTSPGLPSQASSAIDGSSSLHGVHYEDGSQQQHHHY